MNQNEKNYYRGNLTEEFIGKKREMASYAISGQDAAVCLWKCWWNVLHEYYVVSGSCLIAFFQLPVSTSFF